MSFGYFSSWFNKVPTSRKIVVLFFAGILSLGLLLFRDYGVSWDEPVDLFNGVVNANYIAQRLGIPTIRESLPDYLNIPQLSEYSERDHGPAFEYPVVILTSLIGAQRDSQMTYYVRHLLIFLVSYGGLLAFYKLAKFRFHDRRLALLATTLLLATPRLFAERFYNAKDAVFLALFTIGVYTLVQLLHFPNGRHGLWHGLACGAAISLRVNGVLLLPLTVAGFALILFADPTRRRHLLQGVLFWLPATICSTILLWPWLWEAPWKNLTTAFVNLSRFQRWDGLVLYGGELIRAFELPWHYAFAWIGLTTPLSYLAAFGLGMMFFLNRMISRFSYLWRTEEGQLDLLFSSWFVGPLIAIVAMHSVLYDGWRHLYFIYPAMLLFAVDAVQQLLRIAKCAQARYLRRLAATILLVLAVGGVEPLWRIARDHPHQQVYFNNLLPASELEKGFERDYWALSYREAVQWILKNDPSSRILISTERNDVLTNSLLILSRKERNRLVVVPQENATYFLGIYRLHPRPYEGYGWEVHAEYSGDVKIISVHKR